MLHLIKKFSARFTSILSIVSLILVTSFGPQLAMAASMTTSKDTATRLKISTPADHSVSFTLPTGVDFDVTTQTDGLRVDFPATFTTTGTWTAAEFTLTDSVGARTSVTPSQGGGTVDCTVAAGANNFCVAIDTTNMIFTIRPSSSWTPSSTASPITFTIAGSAGNGVLTNPSSVAATNVDIQMCDEVANCFTSWTTSHSSQIAYAIVDDDQVSVTATVNSSITFDLDTYATSTTSTETGTPYTVPLGVLTTGAVTGSNESSINGIWFDLSTNATGGAIVSVLSSNGALKSTAVPGDTIPSATAAMAAGTPNYGVCANRNATTSGTLTKVAPFASTCTTTPSSNTVGAVTTSAQTIYNTNNLPIAGGRGEIMVDAAIGGSTVAHNDYADTLTFVATGTF